MSTRKLTFTTAPAARWWMIAFALGVAFSTVAGRVFPDAMPWSADLPGGTQAVLRLFTGIVVGMLLQAVWWAVRLTTRRA